MGYGNMDNLPRENDRFAPKPAKHYKPVPSIFGGHHASSSFHPSPQLASHKQQAARRSSSSSLDLILPHLLLLLSMDQLTADLHWEAFPIPTDEGGGAGYLCRQKPLRKPLGLCHTKAGAYAAEFLQARVQF